MFQTYRNGAGVQTLIKDAVASFYAQYQALPGAVVVHPRLANDATEALAMLELGAIPVVAVGGCLVGECWLKVEVMHGTDE